MRPGGSSLAQSSALDQRAEERHATRGENDVEHRHQAKEVAELAERRAAQELARGGDGGEQRGGYQRKEHDGEQEVAGGGAHGHRAEERAGRGDTGQRRERDAREAEPVTIEIEREEERGERDHDHADEQQKNQNAEQLADEERAARERRHEQTVERPFLPLA